MRDPLRCATRAFGQPIANYQAIQWMLADMATELDAIAMLRRTCDQRLAVIRRLDAEYQGSGRRSRSARRVPGYS
jgi:alkylation response protein AidB-like acyl-CoA dehydrogenase